MSRVCGSDIPSSRHEIGALAQLGERLICIQEVIGSIPIGSTKPKDDDLHDHQAHFVCLIILQGMRLTSYREKNIGIV